jgi:signal transduction histidine kinase
VVCALGAGALLAWLLRSRLRQKSRRLRRRLEERFIARAEERARIARELHDSLLQGLQGLMFRLHAVRQLLPERSLEAITMLDAALQRGDEAIAEGRRAVGDLRESALVRVALAETIAALGQEFAGSSPDPKPKYEVLLEGKPVVLEPWIHDEVYRIAREAIRNAFQHARATRIEAEVAFGGSQLSIRIRDDGVGIDPQIIALGRREDHWGLIGMRERAVSFGGALVVRSECGIGTEVELRVPGKIAYCRPKLACLNLPLQVDQLIHRHHIVVEIRDDNHRSKNHKPHHENAEGER